MKNIFKLIIKLFLIILFIGLITMFIDLYRLNNSKLPVFNISNYNTKTHKQEFTGILYTFSRKIKADISEDLYDSSEYKFNILFININIPNKSNIKDNDIDISIIKEKECTESKLIDSNEEIKIYSYCIEDIKYNDSNIDTNNIEDIYNKMKYMGFTNKAEIHGIDDIVVYKCNNDINDYYITSRNTILEDDYCTVKEEKNTIENEK